jgi:transcriptional regulator with XRE-family HTH domain
MLRDMDIARVGRAVRTLRVRRGWRQVDLAAAAGVSRSRVGRIERAEAAGLSLQTVERVAAALGARAELRLRWRGEGLDRLLDEGHATLVERTVHALVATGWEVAVEVSFSRFGERGSIDVLAYRPERRALAVIEVKSIVPDLQAMLGSLDRKARLAPIVARERGWRADVVGRILIIWDTRTSRRRVASHAATLAAALPAGTRGVRRWLDDPRAPRFGGIWFVADVRGADSMGVRSRRIVQRRARGQAPAGRDRGPFPADLHDVDR